MGEDNYDDELARALLGVVGLGLLLLAVTLAAIGAVAYWLVRLVLVLAGN